MDEIVCSKCGTMQHPDKPVCIHMAGRKGGLVVKARGPTYFAAIGSKGGKANVVKNGREYMRELGHLGAAARHRNHAAETKS